jgi:hypothetical protein
MLDVVRRPLRFRYRLVGTGEALMLGREVTDQWVDEAHPEFLANASLQARYRYMAERGQPTWRRGPARWRQGPRHLTVENCIVPLANDGENVDIIADPNIVADLVERVLSAKRSKSVYMVPRMARGLLTKTALMWSDRVRDALVLKFIGLLKPM